MSHKAMRGKGIHVRDGEKGLQRHLAMHLIKTGTECER